MARGINRADPYQKLRAGKGITAKSASEWPGRPCVFISHHREDTDACQPIADYLVEAGLDVYFDKYDKTLSQLVREGDPNKVTQRIQEGIDFSTHMLCVVSPKTVTSYWVPFEVGYGYRRITLGVLTLKGVQEESLPDYMKTTEVIRGTKSLNELIARVLGEQRHSLEFRGSVKSASTLNHPLDRVLDWNQ